MSTTELAAPLADVPEPGVAVATGGSWAAVRRRLLRTPSLLAGAALAGVVVLACLLAPVYADHVAHTGPTRNHLTDTVRVGGHSIPVVSAGGTTTENGKVVFRAGGVPIGPQWLGAGGRYVLGADESGRDAAVRLLYGGRTSLLISFAATTLCMALALALALVAGSRGGWLDTVISRSLDVVWAFPVILLGVVLGTSLAVNGFHRFGLDVESGSLLAPIVVIAYAMVPYVARPLRGEVISLMQNEYVESARAIGAGSLRIMLGELLPNLVSTATVLYAVAFATDVIFEASLSFLGAGVQPPAASWGTLIAEGARRIETAPWLALAPGLAMVATTLGVTLIADALRDAFDPRGRRRLR